MFILNVQVYVKWQEFQHKNEIIFIFYQVY